MDYFPLYLWLVTPLRRSAIRAMQFAMIGLLLSTPTLAQRPRPKILPPQSQQYAGRLLLIPRDERPVSWKLPRMVARVAHHEILSPPREILGRAEQLVAWAKRQDYAALNGVIVSLDALGGDWQSPQCQERLDFINWVRQRAPNLPIYGFAERTNDAFSKLVFDDLLLGVNADTAVQLLLAHFLTQTYQRPLKVFAITSGENSPPLLKAIANNLDALGGQLQQPEKADVYFFVHTPNTSAVQFAVFAETLAKTVAAGYYVALADVSGNPEPLIVALRERKQMDALQAYAATNDPEAATGQALAQCTARLIMAKVLRPRMDIEQLRHAERAQIELMLTRYLTDWAYAGSLRARTEQHVREQLNANPQQLGRATDDAETFVNAALKSLVDELFRTQFRHNLHTVMLGDGTRADFQVELLQRFKARFSLQRTDALEIDISVHLPLLIGMSQLPFRK